MNTMWNNANQNKGWLSGEPVERETEVQTFVVRCQCPAEGCCGTLVFNGGSWPTFDPGYHHTCDTCGVVKAIHGHRYPEIRHR